jgi:hypothetical protein
MLVLPIITDNTSASRNPRLKKPCIAENARSIGSNGPLLIASLLLFDAVDQLNLTEAIVVRAS